MTDLPKRDIWKGDAGTLAATLNAANLMLVNGTRPQQLKAAANARAVLRSRGYPAKEPHMKHFDITISTSRGCQYWQAIGHSSIDALLQVLEHFHGQDVSVSVRKGAAA